MRRLMLMHDAERQHATAPCLSKTARRQPRQHELTGDKAGAELRFTSAPNVCLAAENFI